jgi:hypothetical protein
MSTENGRSPSRLVTDLGTNAEDVVVALTAQPQRDASRGDWLRPFIEEIADLSRRLGLAERDRDEAIAERDALRRRLEEAEHATKAASRVPVFQPIAPTQPATDTHESEVPQQRRFDRPAVQARDTQLERRHAPARAKSPRASRLTRLRRAGRRWLSGLVEYP